MQEALCSALFLVRVFFAFLFRKSEDPTTKNKLLNSNSMQVERLHYEEQAIDCQLLEFNQSEKQDLPPTK